MKFYFISGIPGAGKSTAARELARMLNIRQIVSTDIIRAIVQRYHNEEDFPVLFESSYNANKYAPENIKDPNLWGFIEQAKLIKPGVKGVFKRSVYEDQDLIIEGVHLIPGFYHVPPQVDFKNILIVMTDRVKYKSQIMMQGEARSKEKIEAIDGCLEYQDYLIQKAIEFNEYHNATKGKNSRDSRPVVIIENNGTKEELIEKIMRAVSERSNQRSDDK